MADKFAGEKVTVRNLLNVAEGLLEGALATNGRPENPEYVRGICELIGRVRLDVLGKGESTDGNAEEVAKMLGVSDPFVPDREQVALVIERVLGIDRTTKSALIHAIDHGENPVDAAADLGLFDGR